MIRLLSICNNEGLIIAKWLQLYDKCMGFLSGIELCMSKNEDSFYTCSVNTCLLFYNVSFQTVRSLQGGAEVTRRGGERDRCMLLLCRSLFPR